MSSHARGRNPHDSLVRYTFSRPEAVGIVLRRMVHPGLIPFIDFDSLAALPTVDSDSMLATRRADLRFRVELVVGEVRVPLYVALEHQSTLEHRLPCRALVYLGDMWSRFIQEQPDRDTVPAILPILLAQHPARDTPRRLSSIVSLTPRLRHLLGPTVELEMRIDDLSGSVLDDPLARPEPLALVEITRALLHAYRNPAALTPSRMQSLAPQFDILLQQKPPLGRDDVHALWRYVITVFRPDSPLCDLIVESVSQGAKQMYRTIADALRDEGIALGRDQGIALGRAEALAEALLDVLRHRAVPVPEALRTRILATRDDRLLRRWFARALTITSAEALLERDG